MSVLEGVVTSANMIGGPTVLVSVGKAELPVDGTPTLKFIGLAQGLNIQSSKNVRTMSQLGSKEKVNVCSRGQKNLTIPIIVTKEKNAICAFYPGSHDKIHIIDVNDPVLKTPFGLMIEIQDQAGKTLSKIYLEGASIVSFGSSYTANDKGVAEQVSISWTNTKVIAVTPPAGGGGKSSGSGDDDRAVSPGSLVSMDDVTLALLDDGNAESLIGMIQQIQVQSQRQVTTHGEVGSDYMFQIIHDDGQGGITFARRVLLHDSYKGFLSKLYYSGVVGSPLHIDLDKTETNEEKSFVLKIPQQGAGVTKIQLKGCIVSGYSLSVATGRNEIMEQVSIVWTSAFQIHNK